MLPAGVGPHEGKELQLMLEGKKKCAYFGDVIPENGIIPEDIIPEAAFAPYVSSNLICRFEKIFHHPKTQHVIKVVCFTHPGEEWRAHFLLWMRDRLFNGVKSDDSNDVLEGRILGYSEEEIEAFLAHKNCKKIKTA